jgi:hypothetical protein
MKAQRLTVFSFLVSMTLLALLAPCRVRPTAAQLEPTAPLTPALNRAEGTVSIAATTSGPTNAIAPAATTADAENVELVSHLIGGAMQAVFVQGHYAYIGVGPSLTIWDVSEPASPTVLGKTAPLPNDVSDLYVSGGCAYVATLEDGLRVVDVSNPTAPIEIGFYNTPGVARGVTVAGGYAYVADGYSGLRVVDVSDPAAPTEVGFYDTPGYAIEVTVAGDYAYVADHDEGLRMIDVSDPAAPAEVGSYEMGDKIRGVVVAGGYAYVAGGGGLLVVDVSNPAVPVEVGSCNTPGDVDNVAVAGDYAYVADWNGGLRVVDVSDPAAPTEVGFYDTPGWACGVAVAREYAYVADYDSLRVVDVSTPAVPIEVGFYDTLGSSFGAAVTVAGDFVYATDYDDGLWVVDVSRPAAPIEVGFYDTPGHAQGVAMAGDYAYIADGDTGLRVVDVSVPISPTEVGFYDTPGHAQDVAMAGDYAYIADGDTGLRVVDVSIPISPTEVGFYDTPGHAQGVAVAGDYAYIADGGSGLGVVDVSMPSSPTEVGFYDTPGDAQNVAVAGDYAYIADGGSGLRVVDVSMPSSPTEVGFYDTPGSDCGVAVAGDYAYVVGAGLRLVDVSMPSSPTEVGFYDTPGLGCGVATAGDYIYVVGAGLFVLRYTDAGPSPTLYPISNPDGDGDYTVDWSDVTGALTYTLQEDHSASFISPATRYTSSASQYAISGQVSGVWYYRVKASSASGESGWSNVALTTVELDVYEPDDLCTQARAITTDGIVQVHTFHDYADADWVAFDAISGTTYLIEAQIPPGSPADVVLELYDQCDALPRDSQDPAFSPGVRLDFPASADGPFYLKLLNHDPTVYGSGVAYHLSVRALDDAPSPGAVVIVAGKWRDGDPLQPNIHHVTDAVYCLFQAHGYYGGRLHYLATDATLDPDDDGTPDVDAPPSPANLEQAITGWAVDKVGPDRAFTLYLMDHGYYDKFYLDGDTQTVSPNELDGWLKALEAAAPGVRVNVIVEACYSGSFIDLIRTVSKPGRLVIASTGAWNLAYASNEGAAFSDAFLQALGEGMSLYGSFQEARWAVQEAHPDQTPWLDDDGDGVPNEGEDGQEAARRGFAYAGTLGDAWPPYVAWAEIGEIQHGTGVITAEVRDDTGVSEVWAVVYPPSYQPPQPGETEELVLESLTTVPLSDGDGDGVYSALYDGFDETGAYRVVVHAVDGEGLMGRPKGAEVHRLYLPLVVRGYVPPVTFPVHVGDAISQRPVAYQGEVFHTTSVRMPEALPSGGRFYFSSQRDAIAEALVDDELAVLVDGAEVFSYRFSSGDTPPQAAIVEVPRATLAVLVGRAVTMEYRDVYGAVVEASAVWLIWMP